MFHHVKCVYNSTARLFVWLCDLGRWHILNFCCCFLLKNVLLLFCMYLVTHSDVQAASCELSRWASADTVHCHSFRVSFLLAVLFWILRLQILEFLFSNLATKPKEATKCRRAAEFGHICLWVCRHLKDLRSFKHASYLYLLQFHAI